MFIHNILDVVFISLEPTPAHAQIQEKRNGELQKTAENKPDLAQRANQLMLEPSPARFIYETQPELRNRKHQTGLTASRQPPPQTFNGTLPHNSQADADPNLQFYEENNSSPAINEAESPFSFGNWNTLLAKSPSKANSPYHASDFRGISNDPQTWTNLFTDPPETDPESIFSDL